MPVPETQAVEPSLPNARQLAWLLVQATSALDAVANAVVARVEQDATASAVADLAHRFTALVRASGVGKTATPGRDAALELDALIATAKACSASAIATFASGLDGDAAVRSALTKPWSSGQAEGQINRLKLIKRQSYGERASICSSAASFWPHDPRKVSKSHQTGAIPDRGLLGLTLLPAPDHRPADAHPVGDLQQRLTIVREQDDLRPLDVLHGPITVLNDPLKPSATLS